MAVELGSEGMLHLTGMGALSRLQMSHYLLPQTPGCGPSQLE